jgi:NADH:ubiquinone oxidoreductase subunit H
VVTVLVTMNGNVFLSNVNADLFFVGWEVSIQGSWRGAFSDVVSFFFAASIMCDLAFWLRCCCPFLMSEP